MRISKTIVASVAALSLGLAAVSPASAAFRMGGGGGGFHGGGGGGWHGGGGGGWHGGGGGWHGGGRLARRRRLAWRRLRRLGLWAWRAWAGSRTRGPVRRLLRRVLRSLRRLRSVRRLRLRRLRLRIRLRRIRILTVCRPHNRRTPSRRPRTRRPPRAREEAPLRRGLFLFGRRPEYAAAQGARRAGRRRQRDRQAAPRAQSEIRETLRFDDVAVIADRTRSARPTLRAWRRASASARDCAARRRKPAIAAGPLRRAATPSR